ncbi:MAG: hypothetical protein COS63_00270 [Anaerolineae bacterium CG06_land_8_20_14_3_00_57_67]|nr:MAG: hypothetical protein COS63_00270 [Anaerolineae bacterium CG06_land_8_20_14_3_00_57_67]
MLLALFYLYFIPRRGPSPFGDAMTSRAQNRPLPVLPSRSTLRANPTSDILFAYKILMSYLGALTVCFAKVPKAEGIGHSPALKAKAANKKSKVI